MSTAAGERNYHATENICIDCGRKFIIRRFDYANYAQQGWNAPKRCAGCRRIARQQREAEKKAVEDAEWQKAKALKQEEFEKKLEEWDVVRYNSITPAGRKTLCIIGNGFDMMHGVKSSYYSFRDSLGRNNRLRQNLETFLTVEDIWADFENALAHIDAQFFTSRLNADNWLDVCGAYEEDAGIHRQHNVIADVVVLGWLEVIHKVNAFIIIYKRVCNNFMLRIVQRDTPTATLLRV